MEEFQTHVRGALNNGMTPNEIRAVLIQIAVYCGIPVRRRLLPPRQAGHRGVAEGKEVAAPAMLDQPDKRGAATARPGRRSISRSILRRWRPRGCWCASTGRSTRTPNCIRWCAGNSSAACRRTSAAPSCSPTWSTAAAGRYDMPVVVGGACRPRRQIYAIGMGKPVEEIGARLDRRRRPSDSAGARHLAAPARRSSSQGDALRKPDGGLKLLPVPISTPGFDAAPYLTATLCVTKDPESGIQNMGTYRAGLKATDRLGVRMASRDRRRRRLSALAQAPQAEDADAVRHRGRLRAGRRLHRAAEARHRHGRDGRRRRAWQARRSAR